MLHLELMADVTPAAEFMMSHLLTAGCYHPAPQAWASPCQGQSFSAPSRFTWHFLSIARQWQPPACTATASVAQVGALSVCTYKSDSLRCWPVQLLKLPVAGL